MIEGLLGRGSGRSELVAYALGDVLGCGPLPLSEGAVLRLLWWRLSELEAGVRASQYDGAPPSRATQRDLSTEARRVNTIALATSSCPVKVPLGLEHGLERQCPVEQYALLLWYSDEYAVQAGQASCVGFESRSFWKQVQRCHNLAARIHRHGSYGRCMWFLSHRLARAGVEDPAFLDILREGGEP